MHKIIVTNSNFATKNDWIKIFKPIDSSAIGFLWPELILRKKSYWAILSKPALLFEPHTAGF